MGVFFYEPSYRGNVACIGHMKRPATLVLEQGAMHSDTRHQFKTLLTMGTPRTQNIQEISEMTINTYALLIVDTRSSTGLVRPSPHEAAPFDTFS